MGRRYVQDRWYLRCRRMFPKIRPDKQEGLPWVGFKNMEQISDKPTEVNFENMYKLMRDYPDHVMVASIMGFQAKKNGNSWLRCVTNWDAL